MSKQTDEVLKSNLQKDIINNIIGNLFKENNDLYYSSTIDISNLVRLKIKTPNYLDEEDFLLVKNLSARDIQNLLSYISNCC